MMYKGVSPGPTAGAATGPTRVLFLCTRNSARSQLAEALLRDVAGDAVDVASSGRVRSTPSARAVRHHT